MIKVGNKKGILPTHFRGAKFPTSGLTRELGFISLKGHAQRVKQAKFTISREKGIEGNKKGIFPFGLSREWESPP